MAGVLAGQKIIHLLTTIHHGGAERVVLELATRQRVLGAQISVLCLQQLGPLEPAFAAAGIPVALVPGGGRPGALRMSWRLAGVLDRTPVDVVHTHNSAPQITAGVGQRLRHWRHAGTVLVHTEHGRLADTRPSLLRWRRRAAREFDVVCAVSADAQAQMLQHGIRSASGVDVVLNGVDLKRFVPPHRRGDVTRTLVHVGRLDRIKGQDVLLDAFAAVRGALPDARLVIVGDGPARGELERQAATLALADSVTFVGAVDDVRSWLAVGDLFILPSRSEGISIALLEAMASALPAVATDVGGNREVIADGVNGMLVGSEDPAAMATAITALLQAPERLMTMGRAARRAVEARFSSEQAAHAYAALYQRARHAAGTQATRSAA